MNGDQLMAKLLKKEGVEWLSCFPAQTLIEACSQEGIRPILCRQERAGVNMADGYSRIHNGKKIGVFTMQQGPGAENAFGGVAQAYADNVPIERMRSGVELVKRAGADLTVCEDEVGHKLSVDCLRGLGHFYEALKA